MPSRTSSQVETIFDTGAPCLSVDELVVEDVVVFLETVFPNLQSLRCSFSSIICDAHPKLSGMKIGI
jgi:hypothetical protein